MLSIIIKNTLCIKSQVLRHFATNQMLDYKVTVVGAGGGIGQPLSMLLKLNTAITELALHDIKGTPGVAADISHICTQSLVTAFVEDKLGDALKCADVVLVPAGLPRKPGMTRDQLFDSNASVAAKVAKAVAKNCPNALLAFITNPVNSIIPVASAVLKKENVHDPNRLFGVTTLDVVRARKFIGDSMFIDPNKVKIPVIGGHAGITILPLFSQCQPVFKGDEDVVEKLTKRIQEAGTEVVKAKDGKGSATLSMAYAGAHFANALLRGLKGDKGVIECAYVESDSCGKVPFFSTPLELGPKGIKKNLGIPKLDCIEEKAVEKLLPELKASIEKGIKFGESFKDC